MTGQGRVLVALPSSIPPGTSIEAGCILAGSLGLPVSALYIEEPAALRVLAPGGSQADTAAMTAAMAQGGRRAEATVSAAAARAGLSFSFRVARGVPAQVLALAVGARDVVLSPLDFAIGRFADVLAESLALGPEIEAIALVPVRRPARLGAIAALVEPGAPAAAMLGARLAQALGVPLVVTLSGGTQSVAARLHRELAQVRGVVTEFHHAKTPYPDVEALLPDGVRIAITTSRAIEGLDPEVVEAALRRGRATLVLHRAEPTGDMPQ